jgi:hypothetical protein
MNFPKTYFYIISILGILLLCSYYFLSLIKKSNAHNLWGRIKQNGDLKDYYQISMILAAIGFIIMMIYLLVSDSFTEKDIKHIFILSLLIVVVSMFWMPLSLYYMNNPTIWLKYIIGILLLIIPFSAYCLLLILYRMNEKKHTNIRILSLIGMIVFFLHTFILDSIIWPTYFF